MNTLSSDLNDLVELLLSAKNAECMQALLLTLLTDAEQRELPKRLQIMRLLKQGLPQREIAKQLGVGIATVTRGAKLDEDLDSIIEKYHGQR
jgi:TrpR family trp operon transcriptional repressor